MMNGLGENLIVWTARRTRGNPFGALANKRDQMSDAMYIAAGRDFGP